MHGVWYYFSHASVWALRLVQLYRPPHGTGLGIHLPVIRAKIKRLCQTQNVAGDESPRGTLAATELPRLAELYASRQ